MMMKSLRMYCCGATTRNLLAMMLPMFTPSSSFAYVPKLGSAIAQDDGTTTSRAKLLYKDFYETSSVAARENADTLAQLFDDCKEGHVDTVCRNRTAEMAYEGVELSELGFNRSFTQAQIEAISWL